MISLVKLILPFTRFISLTSLVNFAGIYLVDEPPPADAVLEEAAAF